MDELLQEMWPLLEYARTTTDTDMSNEELLELIMRSYLQEEEFNSGDSAAPTKKVTNEHKH